MILTRLITTLIIYLILPMVNLFSMNTPNEKRNWAIPQEAISGVLTAFQDHSLVALDEGNHRNEQGHAFRLSLIRDSRFPDIVNDIVVEFGNARYQDIVDSFVRGEDVPDATLRKIWQDTTQSHGIWDVPIYEEFFRAVREVNASLSKEKHLRVLLGDPPIDWDNWDCEQKWDRDAFPAELIKREVIAKKRRALIIYGGMHFLRKPLDFVATDDETLIQRDFEASLAALLENQNENKLFIIWTYTYGEDIETLQADIKSWNRPSLAKLSGTILGEQDFSFYYPGTKMWKRVNNEVHSFKVQSGQIMEKMFDALLYLGPTSTITESKFPVELCFDSEYVEMRKRRMTLNGMNELAEGFQKFCDEKIRVSVNRK